MPRYGSEAEAVRGMDLYDVYDEDLNMCLLCDKYCELSVPRCDKGRVILEMIQGEARGDN